MLYLPFTQCFITDNAEEHYLFWLNYSHFNHGATTSLLDSLNPKVAGFEIRLWQMKLNLHEFFTFNKLMCTLFAPQCQVEDNPNPFFRKENLLECLALTIPTMIATTPLSHLLLYSVFCCFLISPFCQCHPTLTWRSILV